MGLFWSALAVLVGVAGILQIRRIRRQEGSGLSDDMIARIEASGRVEVEEPLDLEEAREEEERFWEEDWEEPEPW